MPSIELATSPDRNPRRERAVQRLAALLMMIACACVPPRSAGAQEAIPGVDGEDQESTSAPSEEVNVTPQADDDEIAARLERILLATEWFADARVTVDEGVVFLEGSAARDEHKEWAARLARNTEDVVAVVNRIEVRPGSIWDLSPAWTEIRLLARDLIQATPLILVAILLLGLTWLAAILAMQLASVLLRRRMQSVLLRQVAARAVAVPVLILGIYFVLRVSGLTQMAATVIGGTGLLGLVVGIAFRDIAENFLASILISTQRPFQAGDLIEVEGHQGFVQRVTTRGTLLMTLQGNHVQIPNSTIYKSTITNYTANPKLRLDFAVGIDYGDSVSEAQNVALGVVREHPAVLDDPEPLVLVEELGAATVNLRVQFWIDGHNYSPYKVRSSLIRLTKLAIEQAGLTMPDESREVIFPKGVPVELSRSAEESSRPPGVDAPRGKPSPEESEASLPAEGGLHSEREEIADQALHSRPPGEAIDLLAESGE